MEAGMPNDEVQEIHGKVVGVLTGTSTMYLASSSDEIWNAGAFYAELDPFRLTFVLETRGTTLRNLLANPSAAVTIAPNGPFQPFLQGRGEVSVRDAAGKQETIDTLISKEPMAKPLIEGGPVEAVDLRLSMWRVTDVAAGWLPGKVLTPGDITASAS
jgi:hypothetical protein